MIKEIKELNCIQVIYIIVWIMRKRETDRETVFISHMKEKKKIRYNNIFNFDIYERRKAIKK